MSTPTMPPSSDPTSQILLKLGEMGTQLAVISEQLKAIPDHEQRIRDVEQKIPHNLGERLASLEKWRYGLPLSGLLAVASGALSVYAVVHH